MLRADHRDKNLVVDILTKSFDDNKSVNYIVKQDGNREKRIRNLMSYSFDVCYSFGDVFFSEDRKGCALILLPDKKRTNLKSILLDIKLITNCIGLSNVGKAIIREGKIKKRRLKKEMYYLWFIGVEPNEQNKGIGSDMMNNIIKRADWLNLPISLETSTEKNISWYKRFGFEVYNELDLGYRLYFLKRG